MGTLQSQSDSPAVIKLPNGVSCSPTRLLDRSIVPYGAFPWVLAMTDEPDDDIVSLLVHHAAEKNISQRL